MFGSDIVLEKNFIYFLCVCLYFSYVSMIYLDDSYGFYLIFLENMLFFFYMLLKLLYFYLFFVSSYVILCEYI